ncbi:hypothetical protein K803_11825 [Salmonella enterica subsp. enterica serovar Newport str. SHSN013]|nr:hypothetical protein SEEP3036_01030 [Salmonella enterica subsp. enterica serovar Pullorum str. 13036]ESG05529.1 hypothetical protein SEEP9945_15577 [Salmonella enterica subsp. enterica serovar Pullorum str. 19945]ESG81820.1 hypothetical protein SEEJ0721_14510 [Salmonella enterica subsp. enterica serovar Javiana str. 10721]OSJ96882.1 hypothetical protein K803_11825 [Salmonella enterica subsp. enterica serovar Newport str. SHSN013]
MILRKMREISIFRIIKTNGAAPGFLYPGPHIISVRLCIISQIGIGLSVKQQNQMVVRMFPGNPFPGPDIAEWHRLTRPARTLVFFP